MNAISSTAHRQQPSGEEHGGSVRARQRSAGIRRDRPAIELPSTETTRAPAVNAGSVCADLDRLVRSTIVRATHGRSPISLLTAYVDWVGHLTVAPALQQHLFALAGDRSLQLWQYAVTCALRGTATPEPCITPLPQDKRFSDLLREYQDWARGAFERVMADAIVCQEQSMTIIGALAQPMPMAAGEKGAEASRPGAARSKAA